MMTSNINSEYKTHCMQFYRGRPVVKVDERYMDVLTEHVWNLHGKMIICPAMNINLLFVGGASIFAKFLS